MTRARRRDWGLAVRALRHLVEDHGFNHAAAVAYFSLLSLPPFLFLLARAIRRVLHDPATLERTVAAAAAFVPPAVEPMVLRIGRSLPEKSSLVLFAIPVLMWMSSTAFSAFEISINVAFATTPQRRFWLSRLKAFAGASATALVLVASVAVTEGASWLERLRSRAGLPEMIGPVSRWLAYLALLAASFLTFALLYKMLPRGRVAWKPVLVAAGVSLTLSEIARHLFGSVLASSPTFGQMSGALAGIVAFLLWVYTAVVIAVYGAEIAAILNGNRR